MYPLPWHKIETFILVDHLWKFGNVLDMVTTQSVPYDHRSIMHFLSDQYSVNSEPTIVPRRPNILLNEVGASPSPTAYDYLHITLLYCEGKH